MSLHQKDISLLGTKPPAMFQLKDLSPSLSNQASAQCKYVWKTETEQRLMSRTYFYGRSLLTAVKYSLESARNTKQLAVSETKSRRRLGSDTPFCAGTSAQTLAQALFSGSRHALNSTSRGFGSALFTSTLYWFHSGPALRHHAHGQRCCHHRLCSTGYL